MDKTCGTCRWWNRADAHSVLIAECRRNAPQPADNITDPAWWASTKRDDFCGEHQPKEPSHDHP